MTKVALNNSQCCTCSFFPFCEVKENSCCDQSSGGLVKQTHHLKPKEMLRLSRKRFDSFYVVQMGALKAYQVEVDGKELILGFYFPGEGLGYDSISTESYLSSVVALTDSVICEVPYEVVLQLASSSAYLQKYLLRLMSQQLTSSRYLLLATAVQRLAAFLLDLSVRLPVTGKEEGMILPMSRQDIGSYLRLTTETVSRTFSHLQENKIIKLSQKRIELLQLEQLRLLAEGLTHLTS